MNTGNLLPPEADAVIMIEDVRIDGDRFTIRRPATPWQHVRPVGEDIGETEMILPSCHRIRPHEIGALAAYGIADVEVLTVRIGLIPTGSELVPRGRSRALARSWSPTRSWPRHGSTGWGPGVPVSPYPR